MTQHHSIENITFENDKMILTIDGTKRTVSLKDISPLLENASERERMTLEISPSGYGIHWPCWMKTCP